MTKLAALSFAVVTTIASFAGAREIDDLAPLAASRAPTAPRVQFGIRTSVAIPSGEAYAGKAMTDIVTAMSVTDFMLDLRITERVILTPYAGFATGFVQSPEKSCKSTASDHCQPLGLQVGGMLRFAYARTRYTEAWVGYGFSREFRHVGGDGLTANFVGNEHHLLAGLDLFVHGASKLGLYAEVAVGTYDSVDTTTSRWSTTEAEHRWTSIGIQCSF